MSYFIFKTTPVKWVLYDPYPIGRKTRLRETGPKQEAGFRASVWPDAQWELSPQGSPVPQGEACLLHSSSVLQAYSSLQDYTAFREPSFFCPLSLCAFKQPASVRKALKHQGDAAPRKTALQYSKLVLSLARAGLRDERSFWEKQKNPYQGCGTFIF